MSGLGKQISFGAPKVVEENPTIDTIVRATEVHNAVQVSTPVAGSATHYEKVRNQDVLSALSVDGYDKLMPPTEIELGYVASVYENKGYVNIDKMTTKDVDSVGRKELEELNKQLTEFTKTMSGVDTRGVFELIDDLSTSVAEQDLGGIWDKAKNAKPTLLAVILGFFNPQATKKSVLKRFDQLALMIESRGISLESKFQSIEVGLRDKINGLNKNIDMLDKAFDLYYNAFIQLRKQFILIRFMEYNYQKQLEVFKQQNVDSEDLVINNKLNQYERVLKDLTTRRLLLHKMLLQLPVTAQQNERLVNVSRSLADEINNTLLASMPVIRMNFVGIKAAIDAERGFLSNNVARDLEENGNLLLAQTTGDLAVRSELMYGANRLAEAKNMEKIVDGMAEISKNIKGAKQIAQKDIDEAKDILYNTTHKLKDALNQNP